MDLVRVPRTQRAPLTAILRRIGFAIGLMLFVAVVVLLGRDGYTDISGDSIGFLDALYYASVTVTTTGYGDITATSNSARLLTIVLITPARVLFLILVVSTTVEVLTDQTREILLKYRWRKSVNDHFVICGYGATGRSAAADLISRGVKPGEIVAVDLDPQAIEIATNSGLIGVLGDATRNDVLAQAEIDRAKAVIVAPSRDDSSVLIILSIREVNPTVQIVAAGREQENLHLLRQGGADAVIDATAAVGRMLGLGTHAPGAIDVLDDLLDAGEGLELIEVAPDFDGSTASTPAGATLVAIIRNGNRLRPTDTDPEALLGDDRLVVLRESPNQTHRVP